MDGPPAHLMTVLRVEDDDKAANRIPADLAREAGAAYLAEKSIGDLVAAQQRAIVDALGEAGRPTRTIDVFSLDERAMGSLMMHFFIETILAAALLEVDPFDQPAVELGKRLTRQYLTS